MLKQHDLDFIKMIETNSLDMDTINDIRWILKQRELLNKRNINTLLKFSDISCFYKKAWKIFEYEKLFKTLLGNTVLKKIKNIFPDYIYSGKANETLQQDEDVIYKFEKAILQNNDTETIVTDIIYIDSSLVLVDENMNIICERPNVLIPMTNLIAPKLINIVNYTLASLGIDQSIEVKSDFVTAKNGETVYAHYSRHSNPENKIYLNFVAPGIEKSPEKQIEILIISKYDIPKMVSVTYINDFKEEKIEVGKMRSVPSFSQSTLEQSEIKLKKVQSSK